MVIHCQKLHKENVNVGSDVTNNNKGARWIGISSLHLLLITLINVTILASTITLAVFLLTQYPPPKDTHRSTRSSDFEYQNTIDDEHHNMQAMNFDENDNQSHKIDPVDPLTDKLEVVSRLQWIAAPSTAQLTSLTLPVPYVIIHHTATDHNCSDIEQCTSGVRYIQNFHIDSKGWWDIGYNWLVGGDGNAYEGRGWKAVGAHTYGYNAESIEV